MEWQQRRGSFLMEVSNSHGKLDLQTNNGPPALDEAVIVLIANERDLVRSLDEIACSEQFGERGNRRVNTINENS